MKTTNYYNTFITIAEDSLAVIGEVPPVKDNDKSVATLEYEMLSNHPYTHTSDEVLFKVYAVKHDVSPQQYESERQKYFSKGQPCFRSSPLSKRYGWGVHYDSKGKMALYGVDSAEYERFSVDKSLTHLKAMRSKRA